VARRLHRSGDVEPVEEIMTTRYSLAATATTVVALAACASVNVRTATSPDVDLGALRTFSVMQQPDRRSAEAPPTNDPMLVNSISNRALRTDLVTGFQNRGYVLSDHPDFAVAYYASATEKLDLAQWDYGYRYDPFWWGGPEFYQPPVMYTEGTVIVDVINPSTKELLWRGQGVARVSDDETQYEQDLGKTVTAILDKFPRAAGGS
jgi:hypothetical protein